ncbi:NFX1-type zinc finger-containing protein 1-like [Maniola hyperantus]|uniref:NFX1-type zinc finger-containing protein 1-like n=1 Tax=Aphantopus hyperantus TaxID=2795564 RepID=UPI00374A2B66
MDEELYKDRENQPGRAVPQRMDPPTQHCISSEGSNTNQRPNIAEPIYKPHKDRKKATAMDFLTLQNLARLESEEIITSQISDFKEEFMSLLQSPIDRLDVFALVLKLLAKVCQSFLHETKLSILLDVCNSPFILSLRNYMTDLPYSELKSSNVMYWQNSDDFWVNFFTFCKSITTLSPSTALTKCRFLIDGTMKLCFEELGERHGYKLPDNCDLTLTKLREALTIHEKGKTKIKELSSKLQALQVEDEERGPPQNFRRLSVVPERRELIETRPYLRANVVEGGYRDVKHYLDVQFRLHREDCFGPLRDGILQFIEDPKKRKYDNIKVFRNVRYSHPYVSTYKVGSVVELDEDTKRRFKKVNWANNKRFIYGSLVIFTTRDDCSDMIVATILDRDVKLFNKGQIPVSMVEAGYDLYKNETYTMIESEIYFEPYYHVLKAMQDPSFPEHIAMKKYIVDVNPEPRPPAYLDNSRKYRVMTPRTFNVLDFDTCPSSEELKFNESQYEAYKMALTHEFAVIQGPPGTGKTYLGVKVANTLIKNIGCRLLLVSYTNHALDQFLEAILGITDSVVRIGGQSRNEAMVEINLNTIRENFRKELREMSRKRRYRYRTLTHQRFINRSQKLRDLIHELNSVQKCIDSSSTVVHDYEYIKRHVPESKIIGEFYKRSRGNFKDPLYHWLFESVQFDFNEPITLENEETEVPKNHAVDESDDRQEVTLDDFETGDHTDVTSFSIEQAQEQLKHLSLRYRNTNNSQIQYNVHREIIITRTLIRTFKEMRRLRGQGIDTGSYTNYMQDPTSISSVDRWMLYFKWQNDVANILQERLQPLQFAIKRASAMYEESRMGLDYELLKNVKVIGMTTSGAARMRHLIEKLAPTIVIVEEAAEVLEQHIVTALTKNCEHLILIGDHQQLRPSASYMRLARHYNIEVSLFERMIMNDIHSRCLNVQHRMRPEISALIAPAIYPDLQNHPSVSEFPDVRGVTCNVFFFTHDYKEEVEGDSASKLNQNEGDMVLGLANYLMQQGYQPEDVTILAAYSGQMLYMKKQSFKYPHLSQVKITVVDNYQGEESKIILLSLVRNNDQNKIGFLKTENRVCVALSRAREGFYIFGNIEILKRNSPLWTKIAATLESFGSLGTSIRLMCENHNDKISVISTVQDFHKVPEGGCLQKCSYIMPCLHVCPLLCHGYDQSHTDIQCTLKCERIICELNHVCPLKCMDECKPCIQRVMKKLPCDHDMLAFCHMDPEDVECLTSVPAKLPSCGHEVKKPCYIAPELVKCPVPCSSRMDKCGHMCMLTCHVGDDPQHERYLCKRQCTKAKRGCSMEFEGDRGDHQCANMCYVECDECDVQVVKKRQNCKHKESVACSKSPDETPCNKNCARVLTCGHFCKKKCFERCGDCQQLVSYAVQQELCARADLRTLLQEEVLRALRGLPTISELFYIPDETPCNKNCARVLTCGHFCKKKCFERCGDCQQLTPCNKNCARVLTCGHFCKKKCFERCGDCQQLVSYAVQQELCARADLRTLLQEEVLRALRGLPTISELFYISDETPCNKNCARVLTCGHFCKKKCFERCGDCQQLVSYAVQQELCARADLRTLLQEEVLRALRGLPTISELFYISDETPCNKNCARVLTCGHFCKKKCFERCGDCQQLVSYAVQQELCARADLRTLLQEEVLRALRGLPTISELFYISDETPCNKNCARVLTCGHFCKKKCFERCGDCQQLVSYAVQQELCARADLRTLLQEEVLRALRGLPTISELFYISDETPCNKNCARVLTCGHFCKKKCFERCGDCQQLVAIRTLAKTKADDRS